MEVMVVVDLKAAHQELFRRLPDESFTSLPELVTHCETQRDESDDLWCSPDQFCVDSEMYLNLTDDHGLVLNDWSFSQLCRLAGVSKSTVNKLSERTAGKVFGDTIPRHGRPMQLLVADDLVRSIHGVSYTRLWNAELMSVVNEYATEFRPPPAAANGATGLYCGEQDLFAFLIDPTGWTEIEGDAFAPGMFLWNSEVGRRTLGIQTFWFQRVCGNHIVWDAVQVKEFRRRHTTSVHDGLNEVRRIIESLFEQRNVRRDRFADVLRKAMRQRLGVDAEEVLKQLTGHRIPRNLAQLAVQMAQEQGGFTIFSLVDALTRLNQRVRFVGERTSADRMAGALLALVT